MFQKSLTYILRGNDMLEFIRGLKDEELQYFLWTAYEETNSRKLAVPYKSHLTQLSQTEKTFNILYETIDMMLNPDGYSDDPSVIVKDNRDVIQFLQTVVDKMEQGTLSF